MLHHLLLIVLELGLGLVMSIPAFLLYRTDRYNRIFRIFLSFSLLLGGSLVLDALGRLLLHMEFPVGSFFFRFADGLLDFSGVALVYLGSVFPRRTHFAEPKKRGPFRLFGTRFSTVQWAFFWLAIGIFLLNFSPWYIASGHFNFLTGVYVSNKGPVYFVNKIFLLSCISWTMYLQYTFYASRSLDPRKEHSRYMIYTLGFLAVGFSASLLLTHLSWYGNEAMALWALSSFIFCVFIYNILFNMGISYRAGILRNGVLVFLYLFFLSPFVFITYRLLKLTDRFPLWLLVVLTSLLFMGFQYLSNGVAPLLARLFFGRTRQESLAINEYNAAIQRLDSTRSIPAKLFEFFNKHYHPSFVAIYFSPPEFHAKPNAPNPLEEIPLKLDPVFFRQSEGPRPPESFPPSVLSLLYNLMLRNEWGGLIVDLLYKAERLGLSDLVQELVELSSCGAEMILPLFLPEDLEAHLKADTEGKNRPPIGAFLCGKLEGEESLKQRDLELLRLLITPTVLALKNSKLLESTLHLQERLEEENKRISQELAKDFQVSTASRSRFVYSEEGPMPEILSRARRFAKSDAPVLITGETGTGKGEIARLIHEESEREGAFLVLNCSAIPHDLIENELFGHEKGAYTGADTATEGLVAKAEGGTLFLDEVGELALSSQTKLLKLVQDGEYERLGSSESRKTTARFLFATNRNLEHEIEAGNFRRDLYYRISTFELYLPPLRERREDIPLLLDYFLKEASKNLGRRPPVLDEEAREILHAYSYPGNIRELENLILRAIVLSDADVLNKEHLPVLFQNKWDLESKRQRLSRITEEREQLEQEIIIEALALKNGNQREAAKLLNMSRGTLQYKMKQLGLR